MLGEIGRLGSKEIEEALSEQAAVAIIGPRQVGKTTLAHAIAKKRPSIYLDLEDSDDINKLSNPKLFFENNADKLIILDEIHHMPELFATLRGVIDRGRQNNNGVGRFLILGSAAIDLLKQSSESLAGRIAYINLTPITAIEIEDDLKQRDKLWLRGGFPQSYLSNSDKKSMNFRNDFIRTYLERDIPMFGPRVPAETMRRLWTMLAHNQSAMLNASNLARAMDISAQSVTRYIDLLVDLLLVRRLRPYHANISKRLVKAPKAYIRDSGLVHALLGIGDLNNLVGNPVVGASWEGFVIETLLSRLPASCQAFFYRTIVGAEIDLLIEKPDGKIWAIEIKRALAAKPKRGFYEALKDLKPERAFLVHAGNDAYPITENLEAVSILKMVRLIEN